VGYQWSHTGLCPGCRPVITATSAASCRTPSFSGRWCPTRHAASTACLCSGLWQNKPNAIALVQSRKGQVPETLARLGQPCCKLSMSGSGGWSLTMRSKMQVRVPPKRKGGMRGVCSLDTRKSTRRICGSCKSCGMAWSVGLARPWQFAALPGSPGIDRTTTARNSGEWREKDGQWSVKRRGKNWRYKKSAKRSQLEAVINHLTPRS